MNDHAGWGNDGLCVTCGASEPNGACDPRARIDVLTGALKKAGAELRHAWKGRLTVGSFDVQLIARAIRICEEATR